MKKANNKICLVFLTGLMFLFTSCEKAFFEEEPDLGELQTTGDIRIVLNGAWEQLNSKSYWDQYIQMVSRADDITFYYYFGYNGLGSRFTFHEENGPFITDNSYREYAFDLIGTPEYDSNPVYVSSYRALASFNKIITSYESGKTPVAGNHLVGEAYLARGYIYFVLIRFLGEIPLITDIDVNYRVKKSSMGKVYSQIESDLKKASDLLPDNPFAGRTSRNLFCKGTAKAILAEVFLSMAGHPLHDTDKYQLAAETAGEVINRKDIFGYALLPDFKDLVTPGPNAEQILTLTLDRFALIAFNPIQPYGILDRVRPPSFPEWAFYNAFPLNYRKKVSLNTFIEYTVVYPEFNGRHFRVNFEVNNIPYEGGPNFIYHYGMGYKKLHHLNYWVNRELPNPDLTIIRYAHTLLTYAESKARSGVLDASAYEAVNRVRRRANKLPLDEPSPFDLEGLTREAFIDSVVAERKWELCGEPEGRWFDILRLDLLEKVKKERHPKEIKLPIHKKLYPDGGYFTFIPEQDLLFNPALAPDTIN